MLTNTGSLHTCEDFSGYSLSSMWKEDDVDSYSLIIESIKISASKSKVIL